jgi:hypothetical protein
MSHYDLSGNLIEQNMRPVPEREAGELLWERLALIEEQFELGKLGQSQVTS